MTERDPKVSERYRQLSGEEPSREIDQSILAAAHRSVDRPHAPLVAPAGRHRWYYSLAAAAILVLAIAVTVQMEHQQPDAELAVPPPAPMPQEQKPEAPQIQSRVERRERYAPDPPAAEAQPRAADAMGDSPQRADAERLAAERAAAEAQAAAQRKERAAAADVARAPAAAASRAAPPPSASSTPMAAQYAAPSPERELEQIAELRRQGRDEEADKALEEFRKRYPDYQISAEMRLKVERARARQ